MFDDSFLNNSYQTRSAYETEISIRNRKNFNAIKAAQENSEELLNLRWISDPFKAMIIHVFSRS